MAALKAPIGPFWHLDLRFIPTGGIMLAMLPNYPTIPQVAAIGGSWMADRKLVVDKAWDKITTVTIEAIKAIAQDASALVGWNPRMESAVTGSNVLFRRSVLFQIGIDERKMVIIIRNLAFFCPQGKPYHGGKRNRWIYD